MLKSYLGVCFTLVNHDLQCEPWRHLCADNSLKQITKKYIKKKKFWFQKLTFKRRSRGRSLQTRAHLPLNRIHPANTRGQRWQAWRMRAALSRSRGSTWGNESDEMLPAAHAEINNKKMILLLYYHLLSKSPARAHCIVYMYPAGTLNKQKWTADGLSSNAEVLLNTTRCCDIFCLLSGGRLKAEPHVWPLVLTLVESMVFKQLKMWLSSEDPDCRWERYLAHWAARVSWLLSCKAKVKLDDNEHLGILFRQVAN